MPLPRRLPNHLSSSSLSHSPALHSSVITTTATTTDQTQPPKCSRSQKTQTIIRLINKHPWSPTLETSLSPFTTHLSNRTFLQSLRLIKSPSKAIHFFNWAQTHGFTHTSQSYFDLIELLGRSRNLNAARNFLFSIPRHSNGTIKLQDRFFNSLIRSYGNAGLIQESIKLFLTMKSVGVTPSVITFNSLLAILLRRGRTNMAKKLFDEMSAYGVSPDVFTFNILIRGLCMNSLVDDGFRFFKEMARYRCTPDVITYNTLVDGLCRAGKVRIAHNVVKGMCRKSEDLNPNVVTYTTLIRGYCAKQCIDEALGLLEEMGERGMMPNRITYNTLIQGLCEVRKFDKIKEVLKNMIGGEGGEFAPDTCTFNTLMNAHSNAGRLDEAIQVFDKMRELRVQPDSASYSILIRGLCKKRKFERAEEIVDELVEKEILLRDDGCVPVVAAYNPIFDYLCARGKTNKAEKLFRQLLKRGTQDPPSFKILIMGNCKEGTFEAGFNLLVLMLRRDFVPDVEIYESLIEGFLQKTEPSFALKTLEKMLKSSHHPRTSTYHSILAALVKEDCALDAKSLVMLMFEKNIRQNINLSTDTVIALFKNKLRDSAFEIIGLVYDNGYSIKLEEVISLLCESKKFLEARELLLFSLEQNHNVDVEMYSRVITGLCKIKKGTEAFSLYYELTEKGSQPSLSCLEELKVILEKEGKSKEAEFVLKRMKRQSQEQ